MVQTWSVVRVGEHRDATTTKGRSMQTSETAAKRPADNSVAASPALVVSDMVRWS
jgi:hypothetical protein